MSLNAAAAATVLSGPTHSRTDSLGGSILDTLIEIDLQNKPSWYASTVNPASKVPVLRLGKHEDSSAPTIPESHVLLELVSDLYPGKLLPNDPWARAEARYFIQRFVDVSSNFNGGEPAHPAAHPRPRTCVQSTT